MITDKLLQQETANLEAALARDGTSGEVPISQLLSKALDGLDRANQLLAGVWPGQRLRKAAPPAAAPGAPHEGPAPADQDDESATCPDCGADDYEPGAPCPECGYTEHEEPDGDEGAREDAAHPQGRGPGDMAKSVLAGQREFYDALVERAGAEAVQEVIDASPVMEHALDILAELMGRYRAMQKSYARGVALARAQATAMAALLKSNQALHERLAAIEQQPVGRTHPGYRVVAPEAAPARAAGQPPSFEAVLRKGVAEGKLDPQVLLLWNSPAYTEDQIRDLVRHQAPELLA